MILPSHLIRLYCYDNLSLVGNEFSMQYNTCAMAETGTPKFN